MWACLRPCGRSVLLSHMAPGQGTEPLTRTRAGIIGPCYCQNSTDSRLSPYGLPSAWAAESCALQSQQAKWQK
jgi:hypothetical protein